MTKALLPQAFWFRIAASCPRLEEMPRPDDRQRLLDLPESCALPDWGELEGRTSWAEVRLAWNPRGLGIAVRAQGLSDLQLAPIGRRGSPTFSIWVDTRDTRDISRATRFCHRFTASLRLRMPGRKLEVEVAQRPIAAPSPTRP